MYLTDPRLTHTDDFADLTQIEFVLVIEGHDQLFPLGQRANDLGEIALQRHVLDIGQRIRSLRHGRTLGVHVIQGNQPGARRFRQYLVEAFQTFSHFRGDLGAAGAAAVAGLGRLHRRRDAFGLRLGAARRPALPPQLVEDGSAYVNAGEGFEARRLARAIAFRRLPQSHQADLDIVVHLLPDGQAQQHVVGDAMHQLNVLLE